jgi:hypothetical protein
MSHLRIREIMDSLGARGNLQPADYIDLAELIATCLASKPDRESHPDIEAAEAKRARDRERVRLKRESRDVARCRATPHTPRVNNNIKIKNPPNPPDASFEVFYQAYPKRRARGKAEQAYTKALSFATAEELVAGAKRYAAEVRGKEEQFVAHPASWLNQKRWLDEPLKPQATATIYRPKEFTPEPEGPKITEEERQANLAKLDGLLKAKRV